LKELFLVTAVVEVVRGGRTTDSPVVKLCHPRHLDVQPCARTSRCTVVNTSITHAPPSYGFRYRPAARQPQDIDTGMSHLGFRCVVRP
jgi:formylglycine-generating enzyme